MSIGFVAFFIYAMRNEILRYTKRRDANCASLS